MDYIIREMEEKEFPQLEKFLYNAIFVPDGVIAPPEAIINTPEMQVYLNGFGESINDRCLVAVKDKNIIGAVWTRIMHDYGHIDDETPSFAISLLENYRGLGIGTKLLEEMLSVLKVCGYSKASLAVQKANYAIKMYQKAGFEIIDENDEEYIMVNKLNR